MGWGACNVTVHRSICIGFNIEIVIFWVINFGPRVWWKGLFSPIWINSTGSRIPRIGIRIMKYIS